MSDTRPQEIEGKRLLRKPGGMTCSVEGCDAPAQKFPLPTLPDGKLGDAIPLCDKHYPKDGKIDTGKMVLEHETAPAPEPAK